MSKGSEQEPLRPGIGFFYLIGVAIVVIALLLLNALFVSAFLKTNVGDSIDIRLIQAIQFIAPLLLIMVEFWVYDRIMRNLRR